jgi:hypothetical protein
LNDLVNSISCPPLVPNKKLRIDIPNTSNWMDPNYLELVISDKKKKLIRLNENLKYFAFHLDFTSLSPFQAFILEIIDSTFNGQRRRNIINPNYSFCSITVSPKVELIEQSREEISNNESKNSNTKFQLWNKTKYRIYSIFS